MYQPIARIVISSLLILPLPVSVQTKPNRTGGGAAYRPAADRSRTRPGPTRPNIVIIYADDIGYGDLSCYQPANRVKTPHCDRLANEGLRFTDAHTTAATCTPSRYSLMTGEYAWRRPGTGILPGDAPALIRKGRQTLPSVFQAAGYQTGIVGKWHLGLGDAKGADWNGIIANSPNDVGFDYSFIMAATGDRVPTVFIENSRVVGADPGDPIAVSYKAKIGNEPTGKENPDLLKMKPSHGHDMTIVNGVSRIGWMTGGRKAHWRDEDMADQFTRKAVEFIKTNRQKPPRTGDRNAVPPAADLSPARLFFLYLATHDIHVPRVPHERFQGKSGMGARGDALLEFDWTVGEILKTLDDLNLSENTIVLLTSDNGGVIDDGYHDQSVEQRGGHRHSGPLRGSKGSVFEAGTRVPFILRYPQGVKAGTRSDALMSQIDLLASFATLVGQPLDRTTAPDSENHLNALLGKTTKGRSYVIEHSGTFGVSDGTWKYIEPKAGINITPNTGAETGFDMAPQLYNLKQDLQEQKNVADQFPAELTRLKTHLQQVQGPGYEYKR